MTWEELIEKVRNIKYMEIDNWMITYDDYLVFYKTGTVSFEADGIGVNIAKHRTPDQMHQIITALTDGE